MEISKAIVFFSLVFFSLPFSALATPNFITIAAEILALSGHLSMSSTLHFASNVLNLESPAATIFCPSDVAFSRHGKLSLDQLQYHVSPVRLSQETLKTLPFGAKIPTLLPNQSLIVTSDGNFDTYLSINGVPIQDSVVSDDGFMVIYGADGLFDPFFQMDISPTVAPTPDSGIKSCSDSNNLLVQASDLLMSRGFTKMATLLDIQLGGCSGLSRSTIFAPVDAAIDAYVKNFIDYSVIFRRHVVSRFLSWEELNNLGDGTNLETFSRGFMINVTRSGDIVLLNDVPVVFPDVFYGEGLAVHGVNQLLIPADKQELTGELSELEQDGEYEHNFESNSPANDDYPAP